MAWKHRQLSPIGVDIGAGTVRLLQVAASGAHIAVVAAAQAPAAPGPIEPSEVVSANAEVIRRLLADGGFRGRRVVLATPPSATRVKNLRLPCMPAEELGEAVRFEAVERFQSLGKEPEIRYFNAGKVSGAQGEQFELVVIGVAGEVIRAQLDAVSRLGLECAGLDIAPRAAFGPFERFLRREEDAERVHAFLDIGYAGSRMVLTRGPRVAFIRLFHVGVVHFHRAVEQALGVDAAEAVTLYDMIVDGAVPAGSDGPAVPEAQAGPDAGAGPGAADVGERAAVVDAIGPVLEQLGKEAGLCMRYFAVTFRGARSASLTCVGGGARSGVLRDRLAASTGTVTRLGHPLRKISADAVFPGSDRRAGLPEWATAVGLAIKGFAAVDGAPQPAREAVAT
ncbi:MAG: hypothetical protein ACE5E6_07865 [Phycisphaerae bacterium]